MDVACGGGQQAVVEMWRIRVSESAGNGRYLEDGLGRVLGRRACGGGDEESRERYTSHVWDTKDRVTGGEGESTLC